MNYLDTAMMYAGSEALLGKALQDGYREKVKLATKVPPQFIKSREDLNKVLDIQLKTMKTDHIDYYLVYGLQDIYAWNNMKELGTTGFLDNAKEDGRINNAGFSAHCILNEFKQIIDDYDWDFCQIQYNFLDEKFQAGTEGLNYAASKRMSWNRSEEACWQITFLNKYIQSGIRLK